MILAPTVGCKLDFFGSKSEKLSKSEIKREIAKAKKKLPIRAEEGLTLTDIELEYSGGITVWVQCDEEITRQLRAIGSHTLKEAAKDNMAQIDPDSGEFAQGT